MEKPEYRDYFDFAGKLTGEWAGACMDKGHDSLKPQDIWTSIPFYVSSLVFSFFVLKRNLDTGRYGVK